VGSADVISALRLLNQAVWKLEWFARGKIDNRDTETWVLAGRAYRDAINAFQESVRRDLKVSIQP
jgi:hypothetical protein